MSRVPYVIEKIEGAVEGATLAYSIEWIGAENLSSPTATVFRNGQDITPDVMPTGSHLISNNIQTLKPIAFQAGHGGSVYVVAFQCEVDGNTDIGKFNIPVLSASEE